MENTFKFYLQFCIPFPSKPCVLALKSKDEIDSSTCFETHVHFYKDMPLRTLRNYTGGLNNFVQNRWISLPLIGYVDLTDSYEIWPKCSLVCEALSIFQVSSLLRALNLRRSTNIQFARPRTLL